MKNTNNTDSSNKFVAPAPDAATDLRTFFIDSLKDIYWAENALVKALPKMAENAGSTQLATAIRDHHTITQNQVARLEQVFGLLGEKAEAKKCEAMAGLLKEGDSILEETQPGPVRDAGIIAASQKIEHYEIATYGTLCAFAKTLGENDAAKLLMQTLAEEKEADMMLTDAAYNSINFDATDEA
ncbi:ferritin-like domain-containing protein [Flavobacterium sp.]|uniref:YciE/YciF ferroxidase family protein n=1 Tax=Flavobacterium sp. TaxID=239 RepID=UPI00262A8DE0|nr:ferritin-like domain-containing protein [Flavobacterium sp.]